MKSRPEPPDELSEDFERKLNLNVWDESWSSPHDHGQSFDETSRAGWYPSPEAMRGLRRAADARSTEEALDRWGRSDECVALFTPVAIPAGEQDYQHHAEPIDPFEPFGRGLVEFYKRVRQIPYVLNVGCTETHAAFIDAADIIVIVVCETRQDTKRNIELQMAFALSMMELAGSKQPDKSQNIQFVSCGDDMGLDMFVASQIFRVSINVPYYNEQMARTLALQVFCKEEEWKERSRMRPDNKPIRVVQHWTLPDDGPESSVVITKVAPLSLINPNGAGQVYNTRYRLIDSVPASSLGFQDLIDIDASSSQDQASTYGDGAGAHGTILSGETTTLDIGRVQFRQASANNNQAPSEAATAFKRDSEESGQVAAETQGISVGLHPEEAAPEEPDPGGTAVTREALENLGSVSPQRMIVTQSKDDSGWARNARSQWALSRYLDARNVDEVVALTRGQSHPDTVSGIESGRFHSPNEKRLLVNPRDGSMSTEQPLSDYQAKVRNQVPFGPAPPPLASLTNGWPTRSNSGGTLNYNMPSIRRQYPRDPY